MSPNIRYALDFTLCTALVGAWGCGGRTTGSVNGGSSSSNPTETTLQTLVNTVEIAAGDRIEVRCLRGNSHGTTDPVVLTVQVEPVAEVTIEGGVFVLAPVRAGSYHVACRSQDGSLRDPVGADITVRPGPPVQAETRLSAAQARAGVAVAVQCRALDAYGNEAPSPDTDWVVTVADGLQGAGYSVWGTTVGEYAVACAGGGLVDTSPGQLLVLPGPPASSEAHGEPMEADPEQWVSVSCEVRDGYGNLVPDADPTVSVAPDDGASPLQTGLVSDTGGFSATRAGSYLVFCPVPGHDAELISGRVTVRAGLPYALFVDFRSLDCYVQGQLLPLSYFVYDFWGNVVDDSDAELVTDPPGGIVVDESLGGYAFAADGDAELTLTIPGPHHSGSAIEPFTALVRVDSAGPTIVIASPARGSMVQAGDTTEMELEITATVADAVSPVTTVVLQNEHVEPDGAPMQISVAATHRSRWGLNTLTGLAVDACGNRTALAQSYLRSPTYFEPATQATEAERVHHGLMMRVGQELLDDGMPDIDDLATIIGTVASGMDLNGSLPDPLVLSVDDDKDGQHDTASYECSNEEGDYVRTNEKTGFRVTLAGPLAYAEPTVHHLLAVEGGVDVRLLLDDLRLPLSIYGVVDLGCLGNPSIPVDAEISVPVVDVAIALGLEVGGGLPRASLCSDCLTVGLNPRVTIDWGRLEEIGMAQFLSLDDMVATIVNDFQPALMASLHTQASEILPATVESFLEGFTVEPGLVGPEPLNLEMTVSSGIDDLAAVGPPGFGHVALNLFGQAFPSARGPEIPSDVRGAIRRGGEPPELQLLGTETFAFAIKDDLVNQLLWAAWYGGAFEIDDAVAVLAGLAGPDTPLEGAEISMSAKLPPVVMPGTHGRQVDIGIGDFYVDATLDLAEALAAAEPEGSEPHLTESHPVHMSLFLSATVSGSVTIDGKQNALKVAISPDPDIYLQVIDTDEPVYAGVMSEVLSEILQILLPDLVNHTLGAVPMPTLDASALPGMPEGTVWALGEGSVSRDGGGSYLRIGGRLRHLQKQ